MNTSSVLPPFYYGKCHFLSGAGCLNVVLRYHLWRNSTPARCLFVRVVFHSYAASGMDERLHVTRSQKRCQTRCHETKSLQGFGFWGGVVCFPAHYYDSDFTAQHGALEFILDMNKSQEWFRSFIWVMYSWTESLHRGEKITCSTCNELIWMNLQLEIR